MHEVVVAYIQAMLTGYVLICIQVCAHACGGPRSTSGDFSLSLVIFIYLLSKERLLINLKLTVSARTAPESSRSHPSPANSQLDSVYASTSELFCGDRGPQLRSSRLHGRHHTDHVSPPALSVSSSFQKHEDASWLNMYQRSTLL